MIAQVPFPTYVRLDADGLDRDGSVHARTVRKRVARRLVTAVDDLGRPAGFGSYGIDDEGRTSSGTMLVDAAVQIGALTDSTTAARLSGVPRPTVGGRRMPTLRCRG